VLVSGPASFAFVQFGGLGLWSVLHPDKTRIVYCKDADRRGDHEVTSFTFLGYTFRPRLAKNKWASTL